jgi:hypothetical protein
VPSYLVESYVPRSDGEDVREAARRARGAAEHVAREGTPIRYVRTTFLPDDETCFHLFEAPSAETVQEVVQRAGLGGSRIVTAIE